MSGIIQNKTERESPPMAEIAAKMIIFADISHK